jgi:hypothetical protein
MNRKWTVPVGGKDFVIEVDYGALVENVEETKEVLFKRDGKLVVDGKETKTWEADELPKEIPFDIGGKSAVLRKKGLFHKHLELSVDGEMMKPN